MEEKKYLSLDGLTHYDGLIKEKIDNDITSARNYTDEEVAKKSAVQICIWEETD
jgi:hypothetical protein